MHFVRFLQKPLIALLAFTALLTGCTDQSNRPAAATTRLFSQPTTTILCEQPSGALVEWRAYSEQRPTLVLFSNDPFLKTIPRAASPPLEAALTGAKAPELLTQFDHLRPDPLLLPEMSVTAAMQHRMFREVVWVIASEPSITTRTADFIGEQLKAYGAFGLYNQVLDKREGAFYGHLYETPLRIVAADQLPTLDGPVVVHIDLSHFSPLYKDEVRTPLLKVIKHFATDIRKRQWQAMAVTISASNLDGKMPLVTRAIAPILASLTGNPQLLDEALPEAWGTLGRALYQETFFQMESVLELYQGMARSENGNAFAHYGAYRALKQMKRPEEALAELAEACKIDPVFAVEYQQLARQAQQAGQYLLCIDMLQLARRALPNNIFIDLQLAEAYVRFGKAKPGLELIAKLQKLPWSPHYYADIGPRLLEWKKQLETPQTDSKQEH